MTLELKELCEKTLNIFEVESVDDLGKSLMRACKDNCEYGFSKVQCCPIVREKFKRLLEEGNESNTSISKASQ